ncbi:MAG: hypothetical protein IIA61_03675 [Candidatus Marinimicrobia bacterium]|nr:hypothetical protein [Candidatus Neomarinimicrobiota bacterium]
MAEIDKDFDKDFETFTKIVDPDLDPVLLLLRAHLLTENLIKSLIMLVLERGDRIVFNGNLGYYQKVSLLDSFDIVPDELISSLKNLNKVRNKCSHEMDKQITISDIDFIGSSLKDEYTKTKREYRNDHKTLLYTTLAYICGYLVGVIHSYEQTNRE